MLNVFVSALPLLCLPLFGDKFREVATFLLLLFFSLLSPIFTGIWFGAWIFGLEVAVGLRMMLMLGLWRASYSHHRIICRLTC